MTNFSATSNHKAGCVIITFSLSSSVYPRFMCVLSINVWICYHRFMFVLLRYLSGERKETSELFQRNWQKIPSKRDSNTAAYVRRKKHPFFKKILSLILGGRTETLKSKKKNSSPVCNFFQAFFSFLSSQKMTLIRWCFKLKRVMTSQWPL